MRKNDSLEPQPVEIERMANKFKSVSGTDDARITVIFSRLGDDDEEAYDVAEKCCSLSFSQIPHDVKVREFEKSPKDTWCASRSKTVAQKR